MADVDGFYAMLFSLWAKSPVFPWFGSLTETPNRECLRG